MADAGSQPLAAHPLREVALLFLRLGATGFGGPAVHLAMMEDEVVRRRRWLTHGEFLDLLGATNLIPGPNSTEMAIHLGWRRAGWAGLLAAGACFIVPAALVTLVLARAYVAYGTLPQASAVLTGVKPIIIAIVVQALWGLGRKAIQSKTLAGIALASTAASLLGGDELAILAAAGAAAVLARRTGGSRMPPAAALFAFPGLPLASAAATVPAGLVGVFLAFLKVGSVLYGSGYVLLAFLRTDLVERMHWLTEAQLMDAVAVGQVTPGPLLTTATFVGYVLHGSAGALLATLGVFLPSFVLVAVSGPLVPRIRRSPAAGAFLDGVNAASLALMAAVAWHLGRSAIVDAPTGLLAALGVLLLVRFRLNSLWLVLVGAGVGAVRAWAQ